MKKTITTIIAFMVLQTSMFGWHESFTTDATPDASGDIVSDLNWSWWGWGGIEVTNGELVLTVPDPGTDPFDLNTCCVQIDQSIDANAEITPGDFEIWIKMKISTDGTPDGDDQFHAAIAIDPDFLSNLNVYPSAVVPAANMVGGYYFATDEFSSGTSAAVTYDSWFWEKIVASGDTVSVWTFADGDSPSDDAQHVFTTENVTNAAPTFIIVGAFNDDSSSVHISDVYYNEAPALGIGDNVTIASGYELNQNYPNPFNPVTHISYTIPTSGQVKLTIYNVLGEKVSTLVNDVITPGTHTATWNAENMPSGVYFYRLDAGSFSQTNKLLLIK